MKRYAIDVLKEWKNKDNRKPLIIQGARQVGKTWLMKTFGEQYYQNTVYINFNDAPITKDVFNGDYDIENIILSLSTLTRTKILPNDTLIILDEIQECERALNVLKFFNENAPQYHIIAAGSLLGIAVRKKNMSFPVGQVEFLNLYPLSFFEFLEASGEIELLDLIIHKKIKTIPIVKEKFIAQLKRYMFVGGMPEAVKTFLNTLNYEQVREIHNQILIGYRDDFSKYTEPTNVPKINAIWNSIPSQLAKENKKFTYKNVLKGARAREYEMALEWLNLCGLIYRIPRITKPNLPLSGYEESNAFKIFMVDIGLLGAKSMLDPITIINENKVFEEFKGALTEQYVLQELKTLKELPIYYWASDTGMAEIDFIIQNKNAIIPIEVKATINLKSKSLASYRQKYKPTKAIRASLADFEVNQGLYNIPLYLIEFLRELLE